jgi:hypothetical protein
VQTAILIAAIVAFGDAFAVLLRAQLAGLPQRP